MKKKDKPFKQFRFPQFGSLHRGWSSLIILFVFILVLSIVPSLFHMGRRVYFSANYYPFTLCIDDKDTILIPGDIYLKQGKHKVDVYFGSDILATSVINVHPYLFFSPLIEGKQKVYIEIPEQKIDENENKIIRFFLRGAAEEAVYFSSSSQFRIRSVYSDLQSMLGTERLLKNSNVLKEASRLIASAPVLSDAMKVGIDAQLPVFENDEIRDKNVPIDPYLDIAEFEEINGTEFAVLSNGVRISINETTEAEWQAFIGDNPMWQKENKDALIKAGLVDDCYMDGFSASGEKAVVNISPNAVMAYSKWFSNKTGYRASLPDKALLASLSIKNNAFDKDIYVSGSNAVSSLLGGVWEMTGDVFEPQYYVDGNRTEFIEFEKYGVSLPIELFGGSYLNSSLSKDELRGLSGVATMQTCAETIGFRIGLYE